MLTSQALQVYWGGLTICPQLQHHLGILKSSPVVDTQESRQQLIVQPSRRQHCELLAAASAAAHQCC